MGRRAVFVDRDDTLMEDVKYCRNPDDVRLLPQAAEGLRLLNQAGFKIVIVTNQSGIGRGYFTEQELQAVNARLREQLRMHGADYDALYYCPHRPDESCHCRKPRPGLLSQASSELDLDLPSCYTVGDQEGDLSAGKAVGTQTIFISNGKERLESYPKHADYVVESLLEAARLILSQER